MCSNWLEKLCSQSENLLRSQRVRTRDSRGCHEPPPHFVLTEANSQGYTRTFTRTIHCSTLANEPRRCWRARWPGIIGGARTFMAHKVGKAREKRSLTPHGRACEQSSTVRTLGKEWLRGFRGDEWEGKDTGSAPDLQMSEYLEWKDDAVLSSKYWKEWQPCNIFV